jgi:hypothetical protein
MPNAEVSKNLTIALPASLLNRLDALGGVASEHIQRALEEYLEDSLGMTSEDHGWLNSTLSRLDDFEPYEWQPGELAEGELIDASFQFQKL